jgi:hypothetical protein
MVILCVISSFRRDVDALLGCYAALSGSSVPTFREVKDFLDFYTLEDGSNRLYRNVGTQLPLNAA